MRWRDAVRFIPWLTIGMDLHTHWAEILSLSCCYFVVTNSHYCIYLLTVQAHNQSGICCGWEVWGRVGTVTFRVAPIIVGMVPTHRNALNRADCYPKAPGWEPSPAYGRMDSTRHNGKYRTEWHPVFLGDRHPSHDMYASHPAPNTLAEWEPSPQ